MPNDLCLFLRLACGVVLGDATGKKREIFMDRLHSQKQQQNNGQKHRTTPSLSIVLKKQNLLIVRLFPFIFLFIYLLFFFFLGKARHEFRTLLLARCSRRIDHSPFFGLLCFSQTISLIFYLHRPKSAHETRLFLCVSGVSRRDSSRSNI